MPILWKIYTFLKDERIASQAHNNYISFNFFSSKKVTRKENWRAEKMKGIFLHLFSASYFSLSYSLRKRVFKKMMNFLRKWKPFEDSFERAIIKVYPLICILKRIEEGPIYAAFLHAACHQHFFFSYSVSLSVARLHATAGPLPHALATKGLRKFSYFPGGSKVNFLKRKAPICKVRLPFSMDLRSCVLCM